jgi:hypothetical protein
MSWCTNHQAMPAFANTSTLCVTKMKTKQNIYITVGTICFLLTWLFVGIYRDDEFFEPTIFTKYRPTFKTSFFSPIGMQDLNIDNLPADKQAEEIAFQEFVIERHQQNNSNAPLWFLPFALIQITITLLTLGAHGLIKKMDLRHRYSLVHFVINVVSTTLVIGFIMALDNRYWTILLTALIIFINVLTVILLTKHKRQSTLINMT